MPFVTCVKVLLYFPERNIFLAMRKYFTSMLACSSRLAFISFWSNNYKLSEKQLLTFQRLLCKQGEMRMFAQWTSWVNYFLLWRPAFNIISTVAIKCDELGQNNDLNRVFKLEWNFHSKFISVDLFTWNFTKIMLHFPTSGHEFFPISLPFTRCFWKNNLVVFRGPGS